MNFARITYYLIAFTFLHTGFVCAQEQFKSNQSDFSEFLDHNGNEYRSASGVPGPRYWQNQADYKITGTLDDVQHTFTGKVTLTYTNNSPEKLDFVWLYLDQNRFTENSRGNLTTPIGGNRYNGDTDGGYTLSNLVASVKKTTSSKYLISDTRMQVFFKEPIAANGGEATISMDFSYKIPEDGADRMGRVSTQNGTIYALAQWYPRVAVFDDIEGWNMEPYLDAGEFYNDYGDYEYAITAPYNHIVVGSGTLENPSEVLSSKMRDRMQQAAKSDTAVYIIKPGELKDATIKRKEAGTLTWRFKMKNARDVAFASPQLLFGMPQK